jgi:hypothetical protein
MRLKGRWLVAAVAVIALGAFGTAYAATSGSSKTSGINDPPPGAPTPSKVTGTSAGMPPTAQVWYAVVNADGTTARGYPPSTTSNHLGNGAYEVLFKAPVDGCAYTATIGNAGAGTTSDGFIQVDARGGNANGVFVLTTDTANNVVDRPFHLQVTC